MYNCENYIEKTILSIKQQTYKNLEVIIVNDGSIDKSEAKANEQIIDDKRFVLYSIKNSGQSFARRYGLERSSGLYLSFIDSDDFVEPNFIERLVSDMESSKCDLVVCNYFDFYPRSEKFVPILKIDHNRILNQEEGLLGWITDSTIKGFLCNKLFKRDIFMKISQVTNFNFLEDSFLVGKYLLETNLVYLDDTPMYVYRYLRNSATNSSKRPITDFEALTSLEDILKDISNKFPNLILYCQLRLIDLRIILCTGRDSNNFIVKKNLVTLARDVKKNKQDLNVFFHGINKVIVGMMTNTHSVTYVLKLRSNLIKIQRFFRVLKGKTKN